MGKCGVDMKTAIGGYFELELQQSEHFHKNAMKLNTARNCLEYILRANKYQKIYIPYYTCEVILEPIKKYNIQCEFYHINIDLEPEIERELKKNEAFLYINYFGLKQNTVERLAKLYTKQLIVDNSQAFYAEQIKGIDTFYSARKFFGVSDGAYLYTNRLLDKDLEQDISYERMSHLLKRIDFGAEFGYNDFKHNDNLLINQPIKKMSKLTDKILKSIDYDNAKQQRIKNYKLLNGHLQKNNQIKISLNENAVPMVYPYLPNSKKMRNKLIQKNIFVATYWNNVLEWSKQGSIECELTEKLLPLPIDQRYNEDNIIKIINLIKK